MQETREQKLQKPEPQRRRQAPADAIFERFFSKFWSARNILQSNPAPSLYIELRLRARRRRARFFSETSTGRARDSRARRAACFAGLSAGFRVSAGALRLSS